MLWRMLVQTACHRESTQLVSIAEKTIDHRHRHSSLLPLPPSPEFSRRNPQLVRRRTYALHVRLRHHHIPILLALARHQTASCNAFGFRFDLGRHHGRLVLRHDMHQQVLEALVRGGDVALGGAEDAAVGVGVGRGSGRGS